MAKEAYYFSHDYEPLSDPKLLALVGEFGASGYGIYWRIVEMLHSDELHKLEHERYIYCAIAKQMLTPVEQVEKIVEYAIGVCKLFASDGKHFWSERVFRNFDKREEMKEKKSRAGKASAEARRKAAEQAKNETPSEQMSTPVEQRSSESNKRKKRKGKEIKEDINTSKIFDFKKTLIELGVSDQIASDWLMVRRKKGATNTETAFNALKREIHKSDLPANECIKIAVENSWQGFKAEWITNKVNRNYGNKTTTNIGGSKAVNQDESLFCGVNR